MAYLYETLVEEFGKRTIAGTKIPNAIKDNLKFAIRPYQAESFQRFILCYNQDFVGKLPKPLHLLFNMATGSGKTLIMAGLMLYLYAKGYRNFLFFVNSNNIIKKTKDNFLNPQAGKYLFANKLVIDGNAVQIKEVETFDETDSDNINIKFTTIQQLHIDLNKTKENSITLEDFENQKIALIADEAHHLSAASKQVEVKEIEKPSWENTVDKILHQSIDNILLEFTATLDYKNQEIAEKYQDKVIQKYELAQFRLDKYSKEINLIRSHYEEQQRIMQALILNQYRQGLATAHNINLKPVILFKAKRTIAESEANKVRFHDLIDDLSAEEVDNIRQTSTISIIQKAFLFFESNGLSSGEIARRIKSDFKEENCISANNDKETETNQILLNTLEDENNPIRAVFAVQKLNEGWDVLNLFDIVRLYESRDGNAGKPGKTTMAEAQLIGRGARYFPFTLEEWQDRFTRKFDDDVANDLKILEELYYHTKEDSRYISELKQALVATGIYEDNLVTRQLTLKPDFKETDLYKTGRVVFNKKVEKDRSKINSFADLGVTKKNFSYALSSGMGKMSGAFTDEEENGDTAMSENDILVKDIPSHVIYFALTQNPFYNYDNLVRYFPNVKSLSGFIKSEGYLSGLEITFKGTGKRLTEITHKDYLSAISGLLADIETEIKSNFSEYEGSGYVYDYVHNKFKDKEIRVEKDSERADGQESLIKDKPWYVYNANYGTSEEKAFVEMFARRFERLNKKYTDIYLIRNERVLKIFNKLGNAFEPDFILFCKQKSRRELTYQVFIEPKGTYLMAHDQWKEDFLKEIREEKKTIRIDTDKYRITALPFYNTGDENAFKRAFEETLNLDA